MVYPDSSEGKLPGQAKTNPIDDWSSDLGCGTALFLPHMREHAASAKVEHPKSVLSVKLPSDQSKMLRPARKAAFRKEVC